MSELANKTRIEVTVVLAKKDIISAIKLADMKVVDIDKFDAYIQSPKFMRKIAAELKDSWECYNDECAESGSLTETMEELFDELVDFK